MADDFRNLLIDAFGRIRDDLHSAVDGLTAEQLAWRADDEANSIAWLAWHLTRVEDDHIAGVAGVEQAWTQAGWVGRFDLPFSPSAHGYGHTSEEVALVRVASPDLLTGYHDAVHDATVQYVGTLTNADLGRVVDEYWNPPVTLAVRLVSVVSDCLQHVGQAAFVRGLAQRRG